MGLPVASPSCCMSSSGDASSPCKREHLLVEPGRVLECGGSESRDVVGIDHRQAHLGRVRRGPVVRFRKRGKHEVDLRRQEVLHEEGPPKDRPGAEPGVLHETFDLLLPRRNQRRQAIGDVVLPFEAADRTRRSSRQCA